MSAVSLNTVWRVVPGRQVTAFPKDRNPILLEAERILRISAEGLKPFWNDHSFAAGSSREYFLAVIATGTQAGTEILVHRKHFKAEGGFLKPTEVKPAGEAGTEPE